MPRVILVDDHDNPVGTEDKLRAHQDGGRLHRAFSVFIFNSRGELLLQQRAATKYHFGGRWSNTCCGHPIGDARIEDEARTRLRQEMGIDVQLTHQFLFVYRAVDPTSGLTEHELDHVLVGTSDATPQPDPEEVGDWKWIELDELRTALRERPEDYTPWLPLAFAELKRRQ